MKARKATQPSAAKYKTRDLEYLLEDLGIKQGDSIYVTSSWNEFHSYNGTPLEFIELLKNSIGIEGTLSMPSNTNMFLNGHFDELKTGTTAGFLAEIFRRMRGVKRSISLSSSVTSFGNKADRYTLNHEKSYIDWDKSSPYYQMYKDNAKIISFGNGSFFTMGSPFHISDYLLYEKGIPYFREIFKREGEFTWRKRDGTTGSGKFLIREGVQNLRNFNKYIKDVNHIDCSFKNLKCYSVNIQDLVDKSVELGCQGKVMYEYPIPFKRLFIQ